MHKKHRLDEDIPSFKSGGGTSLSTFDVLKRNMARARRDTFLFQIVYLGCFDESLGHMTVYKMVSEDVEVHGDEENRPVTGMLLMYKDCFVNKITSSQDRAYDHLDRVINSGMVTDLKVLHYWPHASQRQFKNWYMVLAPPVVANAKPPEEETDEDDPSSRVLQVLSQFNKLCNHLATKSKGYLQGTVTEKLISEVCHLVPESHQVKFCSHQPCLRGVEELLLYYHELSHYKFYADKVWPLPRSFNALWISNSSEDSGNLEGDNCSMQE